MALTDKLTNIADAIRGKTGGTEEMTLDQMAVAIAGIETGGASGIYMAKVTPASDTEELHITHNLGTTDILIALCWVEDFGDFTPSYNGATANGFLRSKVPHRLTSSSNHENTIFYGAWSTSLSNVNAVGQPSSYAYLSGVIDENNFNFDSANSASAKHFAGVTYTVFIMAASAFKEMEG